MQSVRLALAIAVSAMGLGACTLLIGTSDLSGPADGNTPTGDGGADTATPVTTDAGDGGQAAVDAAADARVSPCKSGTHAFCADFDGPSLLSGWTDTAMDGPLTASSNALSPPFALEATLPRRETTFGRSQVYLEIKRPWARTTVEYDVFLEPVDFLPGDINFGVACIVFAAGSDAEGACLARSADDTSWLESKAPFSTGKWVHVQHVLDPFTKKSSVDIDGILLSGFLPPPPTTAGERAIRLELGVLGFNKPAPAATMRFDNVTVDFD